MNKTVVNSLCTVLFILYVFQGSAQNITNKDSILLDKTYGLLDNAEYTKALEKVIPLSRSVIQSKNWDLLFGCQVVLFEIGFYGEKSEEVIELLESNHAFFADSTKQYKHLSAFYIASIWGEVGNVIKSLKKYENIIAPLKEQKNESLLNGVYNDLGTIYTILGDYVRAKKYIDASKEINVRTQNKWGYGDNIYNLAAIHLFLDNYRGSEKLYNEYLGIFPEDKQDVYYYLSDIKVRINELDSARFYFSKAQKSGNSISEYQFNDLYSDILCAEGNLNAAINFLIKNQEKIDAIDNKRTRGKHYYRLANLYLKNGNLEEALSHFDLSIKSFTDQQISIYSIDSLTENTHLYNEIWIGDILIGLSKTYREKYTISKNEEHRIKAKRCITSALEALDYKRSFFEDLGSSIFANKKSKALYETAIDIYLNWYEESGKKEYLQTAFEISQRHNAFILRQQINERVILDRYSVDDNLKKLYLDQKLRVVETSYMLGNDYSQNGFEKLKIEESNLDSITKIINEKYPLLERSKNDFTVTSTKEIQKHLNKKSAVIKYFEGSEKLYSFVITKKKLSYFVHDNVEEIKDQVSQVRSILSNFRYSIANVDSIEKQYQKVSLDLFENILSGEIKSLPNKIKSLVIIPTGSLTQIPFESMVIGEKESWRDPGQYLISKYSISYNYFCNALTSENIQKQLDEVLAYGLEYDEYTLNASKKFSNDSISDQIIEKFRSEDLGHLYFADDEAQEVAEMFDGVSFINENATKKNFLANVLDFDIVHLSAHSFVDFQYPSNSSIIFTKKDSLTDNLLRIKDVDRLNLNGQLFTLSACNTFFGKQNEGEGLLSMARSFIQSGAGSVVGSFWSVPDEISKSFMVRFYSKLKAGIPKDEALQATKIDFMTDDNLSSPLYRSPAYWSAWVIYGDTQSIYSTYNWIIYLGLGILLLGVVFYFKTSKLI